jgi:hypothetical protein
LTPANKKPVHAAVGRETARDVSASADLSEIMQFK